MQQIIRAKDVGHVNICSKSSDQQMMITENICSKSSEQGMMITKNICSKSSEQGVLITKDICSKSSHQRMLNAVGLSWKESTLAIQQEGLNPTKNTPTSLVQR